MENATKALLISGGILIAMLVLSIWVYLFASSRDFTTSYQESINTTEIQKFNTNFTKFEGRNDITIQEIVSLANYVKSYNEKIDDDDDTINVGLKGISNSLNSEEDSKLLDIMKGNSEKTFTVIKIEYKNELVNSIIFK